MSKVSYLDNNFEESPLRDFLRLNRIILYDPMIYEMLQSSKLRNRSSELDDEKDDEQNLTYFYYSETIAVQR